MADKRTDKRVVFQCILTPSEQRMAKEVAEDRGFSMSDCYRQSIRRAHKAMVARNEAKQQDKAEGSYE